MTQDNMAKALAGSIQNVPLPGMHECLTWQLNVTVHPRLDSIKWVSVIRDPVLQIELSREHQNLTEWSPDSRVLLQDHLRGALWGLSWSGGKLHE